MASGDGFFVQFIEDYFAECDEHLATARRVLVSIEDAPPGSVPDPALLRDMFRSLHTLKGLAGMVGDPCAERVAHALEGALRAAEQRGGVLPPAFVDALFAGVDTLDRCIVARRADGPSPDAEPVVAALARALPARATPAAGRDSTLANEAALDGERRGGIVHHFEFAPSATLAARGVGVDSIRARLRTLGTLLDAKPRMVEGGVVFDFWVEVPPDAAPDPAWHADGLRWTAAPVEPAAPEAARAAGAGAAPAPTAASGGGAPVPAAGAGVVRVDLARLDAVMHLVGDLVISRSRLDDILRQPAGADPGATRDALEETSAAMERQLRQLRGSVMRIRLVPVGEVFERLRFAARDAIRESGKRVALIFHGQATEIDKLVVDRMLEPLLHLVRNAVSHGVESPAERVARGKPAEGTLTLRAAAAGDRIVIDVEDDGAGIDLERVAERARARGLLGDAEPLSPDGLLDLLCAPGFSTRDEADMTSGRGVGMDVVRSTVRALAGELSLTTAPGRGTRFVIELPLTLMILDALLVDVGGQQMAVPQPALREILQVEASSIVPFENNDVVAYRGGVLPLVRLARLFGLAEGTGASAYLLVVGGESAPAGLLVDRLVGLREIVVHPVTDPLVAVPGVAGATELADGRVSLILDAAALLRLAHEQRERRVPVHLPTGHAPAPARQGAPRAPHLPS